MSAIKLPKIPTEDLIPLRFKMPAGKHAELLDYLAFFNEAHASAVDLQALLPHLVTAFLTEDRAFAKWRTARRDKAERPPRPPQRVDVAKTTAFPDPPPLPVSES